MSVYSDDDNRSLTSTVSTASVSNQSMKCPYCTWSKKGKRLFNHILKTHPTDIYSALGTSKLIQNNIEDDCLLELNMTWVDKREDDDFNEFPEQKQLHIFGCLGCNQTYQTRSRAKAHWKKSEKCHKDHLKYATKYLEKVKKNDAESKKGSGWIDELTDKQLFDAVDRLARWYYRLLHLDIPYLTTLELNKGCTLPDNYLKYEIKTASEHPTRQDKIKAYRDYTKKLRTLEINFQKYITLPFDYKIPSPWDINSTPEEDGLPPVGYDFEKRIKQALEKRPEPKLPQVENLLFQRTLLNEQLHKQALEETKTLEPILEEPIKKEKRPSFTMSNKDINTFLRSPSPSPQQKFPSIISNTKTEKKSVLVR